MSDQLLYMLRPGNHSTRLFSLTDLDDIASPSAFLDYTHSAVVPAMRHTFVYAGVDSYRDFVSGVERPEEAAEADFASLPRSLSEKRAGLRPVAF